MWLPRTREDVGMDQADIGVCVSALSSIYVSVENGWQIKSNYLTGQDEHKNRRHLNEAGVKR